MRGNSVCIRSIRNDAQSVRVVELVREGGFIAYPTDLCLALGCRLGNSEGLQ